MKTAVVPLLLFLVSCMGPPAPDYEICRDIIARVCSEPQCPTAQTRLNLPAMDCATTLETRSGCADSSFTFTSPTREQVLTCRLPLVRESSNRAAHPSCEYVDEMIRNCPDVVVMLGGNP